ncbi:hypothetical protein [Idiomarina sp.]|mgnify:CR=1 FL=1|uniref:hypothetical protein n=1 Tax=Idiomarina sp. TaxID=1874361 RepID=UPI002EB4B49F|nr:hypothetical protein [Pseudomonadota bacterium]
MCVTTRPWGFALIELLAACALMALLAGSSVQVILWQTTSINQALQQPQAQLALQGLALQIGRDLLRSEQVRQLTSSSQQSCYLLTIHTGDQVGYRLRAGALQYHGDAFDCAQRGWQSLTTAQTLSLTQFSIRALAPGYQITLATSAHTMRLPLFSPAPVNRSVFDEQLYYAPSVLDWHTCIDHALCHRTPESINATFRLAMATIPATAATRL